jgi:hypothetical protein
MPGFGSLAPDMPAAAAPPPGLTASDLSPEMRAVLLRALQSGRLNAGTGMVGQTDPSGLPRTIGNLLAPNITSMLAGDPRQPPPDITGMPPGKVPSAEDPRLAGAIPEVAGMMASAIPGVGGAGMGARAAESALPSALPAIAGRVAPRAAEAIDTQTLAGVMGGAANMLPTSAEAGQRLTREQRQQLEMQRQQAEIQSQQAQSAQERERQANLDRSAQEIARQKAQTQADLDAKAAQTQFEQNQKLAQANTPFRQKYPELAQSLPFLGTAASFAVPFLTRLAKIPANNAIARQWTATADEAEHALAAGDHVTASRAINQLDAYGRQWAASNKGTSAMLYGTSAALPVEAALLPSEYDAAMLPPDNPSRKAAMDVLTDPHKLAERALPGIMQGLPGASIGSKIGIPGQRVAPVARSEGISATYPNRQPLPLEAVEPPQPAQLLLTPAETKHLAANSDALTHAVPSAQLSGDTLQFDPAHTGHFIDYVNQTRANRAGGRLPPSYYKTDKLADRIENAPDNYKVAPYQW